MIYTKTYYIKAIVIAAKRKVVINEMLVIAIFDSGVVISFIIKLLMSVLKLKISYF